MKRAPTNILEKAWTLHCSKLIRCTFTDDVVLEICSLFEEHVAKSCLNYRGPFAPSFLVDLRDERLSSQGIQSILEMPSVVLPVLEYLKCVLVWAEEGEAGDPFKVQCLAFGAPLSQFESLGAATLGKLVAIAGTVVRMTVPRIVCKKMVFLCCSCKKKKFVQVDGPIEYPVGCEGHCHGWNHVPITEEAECEEVQVMKIQESSLKYTSNIELGVASNKMLEIELRGPMMDAATPGDTVTVCGILATRRGEKRNSGTHQLTVKATSVSSAHNKFGSGENLSPCALISETNSQDAGEFYEMVAHPQWFSRLVGSFCPAIFGLDDVKAALILALIGGSLKSHTRSNIHVLLVGDPGQGKSQLLKATCQIAPRSVFVCANTSSACGLTVSLSRDGPSGETTFEAGAVVHGDGGVTCIDEIDKGAQEHKALLEVMEQESISLAKAGMVFSIPIRTSIIAAGNPVGGKFNPEKSIEGNLNMSSALLSRFDCVIVLGDTPQQRKTDGKLTSHVLSLHQSFGPAETVNGGSLDPSLLARFVAFARHECNPTLLPEAAEILQSHYLAVRQGGVGLPITPRHLQSLIRFSQARAKVELRHSVLPSDAQYAIDLYAKTTSHSCVKQDGSAKLAQTTKRKDIRSKVTEMLIECLQSSGKLLLTHRDIIEVCTDAGCKNPNAMLQQLNDFGIILLEPGGKYRLKQDA